MKLQKIDFLLPFYSQYEVLYHFTKKLYEAFGRAGYQCRLLDGNDRIWSPINSHSDLTIGFNGGMIDLDNVLLSEKIHIPHISCLVDPPYRYQNLAQGHYSLITCDDQLGCELLKSVGFTRSAFMPHAVEKDISYDPMQERPYAVTFLGSFIEYEERRSTWKEKFSKTTYKLMDEAIDAVFADDTTSFITVLAEKLDMSKERAVFEEMEMYIKGRERVELIDAVQCAKVHVFGSERGWEGGWQKSLKRPENVVMHPSVNYVEAIEIMKKSKIVLNSSIKNKLGAHERVFTGAACGAVVVTNRNPYLSQNFIDGKEMILFSRHAMAAIDSQVAELLANEKKRVVMAAAAAAKVMKYHTWDCRVKVLISLAESV